MVLALSPPLLRRLVTTALLATASVAALSGCMRVQAAFAVSPEDLVSGDVIIATVPTKQDDAGPQLTIPAQLADRVRTEKYAVDGYVGQKLSFTDLRFADVATLTEGLTSGKQYRMSFRRSGDLVSMAGSIDLTGLPADRADVQVKMAMPGMIMRTNGLTEDGTITWKPKPGAVTEFNVTAQYTDTSGLSWTKWVTIVGAAAVGVALIVLLLALVAHKRSLNQLAAERAQAR